MRKFLNLSFALALVAGLFAGSLASAGAISPSYGPQNPGQNQLAFPFVHNGTAIGSATFTGSVVIQNLEVFPISVALAPNGSGTGTSATLNGRASKTFSAASIGVADGGGGVIATATWTSGAITTMLNLGMCAPGTQYTETVTKGDPNTSDQLQHSPIQAGSVTVTGYAAGTDYTVSYTAGQINWSPAGAEPATGSQYTVTYTTANCGTPSIGGVEKHEATTGAGPVVTTADETTVDGSNAVPLCDFAYASNQAISPCVAPNFTGTSLPELTVDAQYRWILPIVQTNSGWNSIIHVTNFSGHGNVGVNVYFYPSAGQGVAGPSILLWSGNLGGASQAIDLAATLANHGITDPMVGSVWIDADAQVAASVDRVKDMTAMALTNVAQPRMDNVVNYLKIFGINPTTKYAPLVFRDYNNWNTGINIANLSSNTNQVTITYYNYSDNSSSQETVNIPPRAMEYVYRPGSGSDAGLSVGAISAATISGTDPIAVAVDEVKYSGMTQDVGQAMSYLATEGAMAGNAYDTGQFPALANLSGTGRVVFRRDLSLPLVQKGFMGTGLGDFSGINLFNGDANSGVQAWVIFEDSSGLPIAPTTGANERELPIKLSLPALGSATVYTANYNEMPDGFTGSAVVGSMWTTVGQSTAKTQVGPLVAVSNNVNYAVGGDGSSVFNLYPYEHLLPQLAAGCYYPGFVGGGICIP